MTSQKTSNKKRCLECEKDRGLAEFYKHDAPIYKDKKYPICKICIKNKLKLDDPLSNVAIESVKNVMLDMNKPFIYDLWLTSIDEVKKTGKKDIFGIYKKNVDQNNATATWKDSEFNKSIKVKENNNQDEYEDIRIENQVNIDKDELESLKEIYGHGYPDEEYVLFEKKFRKLKPSFQLPTTMHEEYLREYCVNKVKETLAKARGEFKEAKEWSMMAKEAAEAGKLKPSQMSKADLSKGLDGFGQLSRMVEQHSDILPLLPKFTQQPKDKVDITLWLYINYVRDLQGLPEADYKDIYNFYEVRRKDYESQELDSSPEMQVMEEDE
jgi:hypothetical protein